MAELSGGGMAFQIGPLNRVTEAVDALAEVASALPSPMEPEEGVPILTRARGLARAALEYLDDDRADLLTALLHPDFFDKDKDYESFVARASMAVLRGYLRGCLLEAQMEAQIEANARAYAEAKVKEERGVGFRPRG